MKFNIKGYYNPTPKNIQKISDSVQAACLTALGYSAFTSSKRIAIITVSILVISKFISECFSCDDNV